MNLLYSRAPFIRFVFSVAGIHMFGTYLVNELQTKTMMLTVSGFKDSD